MASRTLTHWQDFLAPCLFQPNNMPCSWVLLGQSSLLLLKPLQFLLSLVSLFLRPDSLDVRRNTPPRLTCCVAARRTYSR